MDTKKIVNHEGRSLDLLGLELRVLMTAQETGGAFELVHLSGGVGTGIPPHQHSQEDEVFQILEGRARFLIGGDSVEVGPGTVITASRNEPHGFEVLEDLKMYFWVFPANLESMFDQLSELGKEGAPTPEQIGSVCDPFGIKFLH